MDIKKFIANLEEYICVVLLTIMTIVVSWQVFNRFILKASLPWSEELSIYILVWVTFLGASIGVKRGAHIGVEAFILLLPKKAQKFFVLLSYIISASFFMVLVYFGLEIVKTQIATGQVSPAMRIPMYYAYLSIPVGSGFITVRFLEKFISELRNHKASNVTEISAVGGDNI